jgi:F420H(2)-dependent quinone reductase
MMKLRRWLYRGERPNRVARAADRLTAALAARGRGPDYLVTLEVPGRRSGRTVDLPLVMAEVGGERYLVSMLGEGVNWVRNVRAAGARPSCATATARRCASRESPPERRAPVLKAYLGRAPNARTHVPVDKDAPLEEFERVAPRFPVFRVVARDT